MQIDLWPTRTVVILTTISPLPEAVQRQRTALASWKRAGFHAVSLNFAWEREQALSDYPELDQIEIAQEKCAATSRRAYVSVADLIEYSFQKNVGKACMILNADIVLLPDAREILQKEPIGVTMIPRWHVDRFPAPQTMELDPWGYDGLVLGPELRGVFKNRAFGMGYPWWDYWIPFRALHLGFHVKTVKLPIALHVWHKKIWSEEDRARLRSEMWREVGVPTWKRLWLRHFGPKKERRFYGHHNHLAGFVRQKIMESTN